MVIKKGNSAGRRVSLVACIVQPCKCNKKVTLNQASKKKKNFSYFFYDRPCFVEGANLLLKV